MPALLMGGRLVVNEDVEVDKSLYEETMLERYRRSWDLLKRCMRDPDSVKPERVNEIHQECLLRLRMVLQSSRDEESLEPSRRF